jgi:hypothetical protein
MNRRLLELKARQEASGQAANIQVEEETESEEDSDYEYIAGT